MCSAYLPQWAYLSVKKTKALAIKIHKKKIVLVGINFISVERKLLTSVGTSADSLGEEKKNALSF